MRQCKKQAENLESNLICVFEKLNGVEIFHSSLIYGIRADNSIRN